MKLRHVVTVVAAAAVALFATGCGDESDCPTEAAAVEPGQNMADQCTVAAPQQVRIRLELCEQCSRTGASCGPQLLGGGEIFLDTSWEVCEEDRSCLGEACSMVDCILSVPDGNYTVSTLDASGSTKFFDLDVSGGTPSCSGTI
jgi:hypothetical protein